MNYTCLSKSYKYRSMCIYVYACMHALLYCCACDKLISTCVLNLEINGFSHLQETEQLHISSAAQPDADINPRRRSLSKGSKLYIDNYIASKLFIIAIASQLASKTIIVTLVAIQLKQVASYWLAGTCMPTWFLENGFCLPSQCM